jgi:SAM-dependent methyltransferase
MSRSIKIGQGISVSKSGLLTSANYRIIAAVSNMNTGNSEIKPIAIPGIHERFLPFFENQIDKDKRLKILDFGAGNGYFSMILYEKGYNVIASDRFPENFKFNKVKCHMIESEGELPFEENTFDIIIAIEVMEHIHDHKNFFSEAARILKKSGRLIITTPNILSLKSRLRFLLSGFYYSFIALDYRKDDGLQHVASLTYDQYNNLAVRNGFNPSKPFCDKYQKSSLWLMFLVPFIRLYDRFVEGKTAINNSRSLLFGRILFLDFLKR